MVLRNIHKTHVSILHEYYLRIPSIKILILDEDTDRSQLRAAFRQEVR